jgi:hypothetical protein
MAFIPAIREKLQGQIPNDLSACGPCKLCPIVADPLHSFLWLFGRWNDPTILNLPNPSPPNSGNLVLCGGEEARATLLHPEAQLTRVKTRRLAMKVDSGLASAFGLAHDT